MMKFDYKQFQEEMLGIIERGKRQRQPVDRRGLLDRLLQRSKERRPTRPGIGEIKP